MTATTAPSDIAKAKVAKELKAAVEYLKSESRKMKEYSKKEEALLPPAQAAAMLGISPQAINKRIREGSLRTYQVFGKTYLAGKQIEGMMTERLNRLLAAGTDKNELEKNIYKKWVVNSKLAKGKGRQESETKRT